MTTTLHIKPRSLLLALFAAIVVGGSTYAFTASNTVSASAAGSGMGAVSGFDATDVAYTLTAANPSTVDAIVFDIDPVTALTVKVKAGTAGAWKVCANVTGTVTCDYSAAPITLSAVDQLTVVAVD